MESGVLPLLTTAKVRFRTQGSGWSRAALIVHADVSDAPGSAHSDWRLRERRAAT